MATEDLTFTTARRRKTAIKFDLDGEEYSFTAPKNAMMVMPAIDELGNDNKEVAMAMATKAAFDWLDQGLSDKQAEHLRDRLMDPDDDFDITDLRKIIDALIEKVAGRPTTQRSGSASPRKRTGKK